jgi:hypothetical protein
MYVFFFFSFLNTLTPTVLMFTFLGVIHEYLGLWSRAPWHSWQPFEHTPVGIEAPYARVNALLHRLDIPYTLVSVLFSHGGMNRGGANWRKFSVL